MIVNEVRRRDVKNNKNILEIQGIRVVEIAHDFGKTIQAELHRAVNRQSV